MLFWTLITMACLLLAGFFFSQAVNCTLFWDKWEYLLLLAASVLLILAGIASAYMAG